MKHQKKRNADGSTLYIDSQGKTWKITRECLPKKRGSFNFYIGECLEDKRCVRERLLRNVKESIEKKIVESLVE
jgi:hypothetical protein